MSKSPTFMVFHLRELIYTLVFILLGIVLIVSLVIMFSKKGDTNSSQKETTSLYEPGVYTSTITLNGNPMDISVTLDANHINSVTLDNLSESVATMYPLVQPAFNDIADQIVTTQSLENIQFKEDSKYTYTILLDKVSEIINGAKQ